MPVRNNGLHISGWSDGVEPECMDIAVFERRQEQFVSHNERSFASVWVRWGVKR